MIAGAGPAPAAGQAHAAAGQSRGSAELVSVSPSRTAGAASGGSGGRAGGAGREAWSRVVFRNRSARLSISSARSLN